MCVYTSLSLSLYIYIYIYILYLDRRPREGAEDLTPSGCVRIHGCSNASLLRVQIVSLDKEWPIEYVALPFYGIEASHVCAKFSQAHNICFMISCMHAYMRTYAHTLIHAYAHTHT